MNWREQAASSHYRTAVAVRQELRAGRVEEAAAGIEELIEALGRSERRALKSQLVRLMAHVLKWQTQPEHRSRSWSATIRNARKEIKDIQEDTPRLTEDVIRSLWDDCLDSARDQVEAETDQELPAAVLSWDEIFTAAYRI